MAGRLRLLTVLLVVAAFVLVPFALWGDQMDAAVPALLSSQATRWAVALLGVSLLVVDVLVPIPTSVVSVMLCVALGFPWGMAAVFAGFAELLAHTGEDDEPDAPESQGQGQAPEMSTDTETEEK